MLQTVTKPICSLEDAFICEIYFLCPESENQGPQAPSYYFLEAVKGIVFIL